MNATYDANLKASDQPNLRGVFQVLVVGLDELDGWDVSQQALSISFK